jgi:hypothetical protein
VADEPHFLEVTRLEQEQVERGEEARWLGDSLQHIAHHDPAYVLADIEAKRQIVQNHDRHVPCQPGYGASRHAVRCLAMVYSDHPDYQQEWRP